MAGPFAGAALLAALRAAGGLRGALISGGIGAAASGISSMLNPEDSWAGKTGAVLGSGLAVPGALGGAALGGILAGPKYRRYGGLVGGITGAALGGGIGSSALGAVGRQLAGENEDPLIAAANAQLEVEKRRMEQLMPLQSQQASMATQLEMDRARQMEALMRQRERQQAANQLMLDGQRSSAAMQQQLMLSILGEGFSV